MLYQVIKLEKKFRYHATVLATPNGWWEKHLLRKKTAILQYQGTLHKWADHRHRKAPDKIALVIDTKFQQQYGRTPFLDLLLHTCASILSRLPKKFFRLNPPPFTGKQEE